MVYILLFLDSLAQHVFEVQMCSNNLICLLLRIICMFTCKYLHVYMHVYNTMGSSTRLLMDPWAAPSSLVIMNKSAKNSA